MTITFGTRQEGVFPSASHLHNLPKAEASEWVQYKAVDDYEENLIWKVKIMSYELL